MLVLPLDGITIVFPIVAKMIVSLGMSSWQLRLVIETIAIQWMMVDDLR